MSITDLSEPISLGRNSVFDGNERLRGRLPILVLLYLLAVFLPINFSLGSVNMTPVRLLLIITIIPMAASLLMGRYGRVLPTDILFFLHFCWVVIALAVNNPTQVIQNAGSTGVEFIGSYALGRAFIRDRADFIVLIRSLVVISLICFPFVIVETITGNSLILNVLNKLPGISAGPDLSMERRMGLERVQMIFVHPIHWGLYCSLLLPLCFVGLKDIYSGFEILVVSLIVGISGLLALSSGALLAMVLQIFLFSWALIFRHTAKRWVILLSVIAVFYVLIDLLSNRTPIMVFLSYATFSAHTAYWRSIIFEWGMINVWANPIFGLGLNDWVRPSWMYSGSMDNFWLVMGVKYGIPGFAFLAAGYLIALWKIGRRQFDGDRILWNLRRAWMFSFLGLTFTISTVHIWHTIYAFVFFMFGAGMWFLTTALQDGAALDTDGEGSATDPAARGPGYAHKGLTKGTSRPDRGALVPASPQLEAKPSGASYTRFPTKHR